MPNLVYVVASWNGLLKKYEIYIFNKNSTLSQVGDLQNEGNPLRISFVRTDLAIRMRCRIDFPLIRKNRRSLESVRLSQSCTQPLVDPLLLAFRIDLAERTLNVGNFVILASDLINKSYVTGAGHSSMDSSAPTILPPRVRIPSKLLFS